MDADDLRNINNLIGLWCLLGARPEPSLPSAWSHPRWPSRTWFPLDHDATEAERLFVEELLALEPQRMMPDWHDHAVRDPCLGTHLKQWFMSRKPLRGHVAGVRAAEDEGQLTRWTETIEAAFGYRVDRSVLRRANEDERFRLIVDESLLGGVAVFADDGVCGVHYMGVRKEGRGRGLARRLVDACLDHAATVGCDLVTLQASAMGRPVYHTMGFGGDRRLLSLGRIS